MSNIFSINCPTKLPRGRHSHSEKDSFILAKSAEGLAKSQPMAFYLRRDARNSASVPGLSDEIARSIAERQYARALGFKENIHDQPYRQHSGANS